MKVIQSPDAKFGTSVAAASKRPEVRAESLTRAPAAETAASRSSVTQAMTNDLACPGTDVFDAVKVEAIRAAIENGSFSVNVEAVADRLLISVREMLGMAATGLGPRS